MCLLIARYKFVPLLQEVSVAVVVRVIRRVMNLHNLTGTRSRTFIGTCGTYLVSVQVQDHRQSAKENKS